ncbi:MAG: alkaline phosphatase D family protein [Solirubrobacteraceae bacterium MAG38_C4-C5]|nr:alkaline phosphatase D family protein [Candidatus Siliceabacter maunaloa]
MLRPATNRLSRRAFLSTVAVTGGAIALTRDLSALAQMSTPPMATGGFPHGVACGQATCTGITLWALVGDLEQRSQQPRSRVRLEVARDRDFANVVIARDALVEPMRNGTVHVRLSGGPLMPGEEFFYRFETADTPSLVGRFRTSRPADSCEPVRIGFFSCQDYEQGFYTAHRDMAAQDLDLVVCLGDYLYEEATDEEALGRAHVPDTELASLSDYRTRYDQYQTDSDLIAMRAAHPLMAIWDDHELDDNYSFERAGDDNPRVGDIDFSERRDNAYQAFFEHMPRIRNSSVPDRIHGSLSLGGNAELFLLDTRQFRDDQPCGDQFGTTNCLEGIDDPGRTMLGAQQKQWLKDGLAASRATWKVVANQVMFMSLDFPAGNALNPDQWDGYSAEREELMRFLLDREIQDVTVLTGDIHIFFAGQITPSGAEPDTTGLGSAATEFVGGSISSRGIADSASRTPEDRALLGDLFDSGVRTNNPHIVYSNQDVKGYGILEARQDELLVEYRGVQDARVPNSEVSTLQRFRVARGTPRVEVLGPPLGSFPN